MPIATVKLFKHFEVVDEMIKARAKVGLEAASVAALSEINSIWPHGGFHTEPVEATFEGFKSGVSAEREKKAIAHFHDHGTLGHFRRGARTDPKKPRLRDYSKTRKKTYTRDGKTYKAGEPTGIKAKRFYAKGRVAGKRALLRAVGL